MKRDLVFSGALGLVVGWLLYFAASWARIFVPTLFAGFIPATVAFIILLLTALAEMPLMVFALRKMTQQATIPRRVITGAFGFYVFFAEVYALMLALLIEPAYSHFSGILAALGMLRLISGIFIR